MGKLRLFLICGLLSLVCNTSVSIIIVLVNKSGISLKFVHIDGLTGIEKKDSKNQNPLKGYKRYGLAFPDGEAIVYKDFDVGRDKIYFSDPKKWRFFKKLHYKEIVTIQVPSKNNTNSIILKKKSWLSKRLTNFKQSSSMRSS